MDAKVKTQHREKPKFSIHVETLCCILDIGSSNPQDTKYGKILDLYWHTKLCFLRSLGRKCLKARRFKGRWHAYKLNFNWWNTNKILYLDKYGVLKSSSLRIEMDPVSTIQSTWILRIKSVSWFPYTHSISLQFLAILCLVIVNLVISLFYFSTVTIHRHQRKYYISGMLLFPLVARQ